MSGFQHSVKVPTPYRRITAILKTALENRQKSIKNLIYEEKHNRNVNQYYSVVRDYIENRGAIDAAIKETKILEENPRFNPVLCKVLITELIVRKNSLNGESKPVQTVRDYKDRLEKALSLDTISNERKPKDVKPRYVRVNTNLLSVEEADVILAQEYFRKMEHPPFENYEDFLKAVKELDDDEYMLDMHVDGLLIFHQKHKKFFACHNLTLERKFMLQDKGTCLVAELLRPPVGSIVLDMCAAPGMKTIHTCNLLKNQGTIYAVEQSVDRYSVLLNMTKDAGCHIVKPIKADALTVTAEQCPGVEYIIVDPSCTGSGILNRLSLQDEEKNPERIKQLAGLQIKMLSHAMTAFPDVKRISYSTCSLYEEENEQVISKCLKLNPNFKLLSAKKGLRKKWRNVGSSEYKNIGKNCIYSIPNDDLTDGIFIALFEKYSSMKEK